MVGEFVFDWCESAESSLPASAVVGVPDPGDDREAQLLAGLPAATVEDVLFMARMHGISGLLSRLDERDVSLSPDPLTHKLRRDAQRILQRGARVIEDRCTGGAPAPARGPVARGSCRAEAPSCGGG